MKTYCLIYTTALAGCPWMRAVYFPNAQAMVDYLHEVRQTDPKCIVHAVDEVKFRTSLDLADYLNEFRQQLPITLHKMDDVKFKTRQDLADFLNGYAAKQHSHEAAGSPLIERFPNERGGA